MSAAKTKAQEIIDNNGVGKRLQEDKSRLKM